jgi:CRP/FNR family transcriptional regulator
MTDAAPGPAAAWIDTFPRLAELPKPELDALTAHARTVTLPAGTTVFAPGRPPENFLLLLDGRVRVQQTSESGRDIVLYRVSGGETCIMTTACLLSGDLYAAEGVTETDVTAVAIPKQAFDAAIARSAAFRRMIFSEYSHRIADVMHVVEEVAFERIDKRLAQRLIALAADDGAVAATHQQLAVELGTAREVVGRQLKELERRGLVAVSRGRVTITDRAGLDSVAAA